MKRGFSVNGDLDSASKNDDLYKIIPYDSNQVIVEYLVAYKRVRTLCDCGHNLMERTVVKEGSENRSVLRRKNAITVTCCPCAIAGDLLV